VRQLRYIERGLDSRVNFRDFAGIGCAHAALQTVAWNCDDVVEIRDAPCRKSLAAAEKDLGRDLADSAGHEDHDNPADAVENRVPSENHDRPCANRFRQLSPPNLASLHGPGDFQGSSRGSSLSSSACPAATSAASRSVIAAASTYCRSASITSASTSQSLLAASFRSRSSTVPETSTLMNRVYLVTDRSSRALGSPAGRLGRLRPARDASRTSPCSRRRSAAADGRR